MAHFTITSSNIKCFLEFYDENTVIQLWVSYTLNLEIPNFVYQPWLIFYQLGHHIINLYRICSWIFENPSNASLIPSLIWKTVFISQLEEKFLFSIRAQNLIHVKSCCLKFLSMTHFQCNISWHFEHFLPETSKNAHQETFMYHSLERRTCRSPKLKDSRNNIHVSSFCLFLERSWHQQKYRKRKRTPPVTRRHISPQPEKHGRRETRDRNKFSFFYYYYYYYYI